VGFFYNERFNLTLRLPRYCVMMGQSQCASLQLIWPLVTKVRALRVFFGVYYEVVQTPT